jgi:hypothetical protein
MLKREKNPCAIVVAKVPILDRVIIAPNNRPPLALEENYEDPSEKKIKIYKESPPKLFGSIHVRMGS